MKDEKESSSEREKVRKVIREAIAELDLPALLKNVIKVELAKLRGKVE